MVIKACAVLIARVVEYFIYVVLSYLLGHVLLAEYATVPPRLSSITLTPTLKVIVVGFGGGRGALVQDTGMKSYSHYCRLQACFFSNYYQVYGDIT